MFLISIANFRCVKIVGNAVSDGSSHPLGVVPQYHEVAAHTVGTPEVSERFRFCFFLSSSYLAYQGDPQVRNFIVQKISISIAAHYVSKTIWKPHILHLAPKEQRERQCHTDHPPKHIPQGHRQKVIKEEGGPCDIGTGKDASWDNKHICHWVFKA